MKVVVWISFLLLIAAYICGPLLDPDLWWHVTVGRWIIAHAQIPHQDYWNLTGVGQAWRAYSWSNEIIYAAIDNLFGEQGLLMAQVLLAIILAFSLFYCFGKISKDWTYGALIATAVTAGSYGHFALRPQTFTWLYFIWAIYVATSIAKKGLNRRDGFLLFLIMVIWANTHITTILGLLVALTWGVRWEEKYSRIPSAVKLAAIVVLGMLATPYLGGELLTFASKASHPFKHGTIVEFQPANLQQYPTGVLLFLVILFALFLHYRPNLVAGMKLIVTGGFIIAGLGVIKFLPQALILVGVLLCEAWGTVSPDRRELGALGEGIVRLKALIAKIPKEGLSFVLIALAIVNYNKIFKEPLDYNRTPVKPIDFIKKEKLPYPVSAMFGDGGYLMYRFSDRAGNPEFLVAIDGRTNVTSPEILEKHGDAAFGHINWREFFDKTKPATILWRNGAPLVAILLNGVEWCSVYNDGTKEEGYTVFVKREYYETIADRLPSRNCAVVAKPGTDKYFKVELN